MKFMGDTLNAFKLENDNGKKSCFIDGVLCQLEQPCVDSFQFFVGAVHLAVGVVQPQIVNVVAMGQQGPPRPAQFGNFQALGVRAFLVHYSRTFSPVDPLNKWN